jgi:hypothetical protein
MMLGRWAVQYFPAGKLLHADGPIEKFDELEDRSLVEHPRMRRILVRLRPHWPFTCFYLHWSDDTDLRVLDELVGAGCATEDYFTSAVVGEAVDMTCLECRSKLRVIALEVVVTGLLFKHDDLARTSRHAYKSSCPACGTRWKASVLEFLDQD